MKAVIGFLFCMAGGVLTTIALISVISLFAAPPDNGVLVGLIFAACFLPGFLLVENLIRGRVRP